MQHLEGALIQRLQQRREHVEAPCLHGQLALRISLEGGQVVVELGVLLGQGHVLGYIAWRDRVVVVVGRVVCISRSYKDIYLLLIYIVVRVIIVVVVDISGCKYIE